MGIAHGSCSGGTDAFMEFGGMLWGGVAGRSLNATTFLRYMSHTAGVNTGLYFGLKGRIIPTTSACTSGSQGVGYAYEAIKYGKQQLMVAGGSEELHAAYAAVLYPAGLLDETPTVLALRTFATAADDGGGHAEFDVVVPIASLASRLERARDGIGQIVSDFDPAARKPVRISLPMGVASATWAAISPPRGGWHALPATQAPLLEQTARAGIDACVWGYTSSFKFRDGDHWIEPLLHAIGL